MDVAIPKRDHLKDALDRGYEDVTALRALTRRRSAE
jgi:hypothetical protein